MHVVTPALPESAKFITPDGAIALTVPVTVAVKVIVPPKDGAADAVNATVGVA